MTHDLDRYRRHLRELNCTDDEIFWASQGFLRAWLAADLRDTGRQIDAKIAEVFAHPAPQDIAVPIPVRFTPETGGAR